MSRIIIRKAIYFLTKKENSEWWKEFKNKLLHAVNSIKVGSPRDFDVKLGLLSTPINDRIEKIINSFQVTPGILWGVKAGDYFYETEFFGPILGVMKAKNVNEAVSLANGVAYGLTAGIESLNPPSVKYWTLNIKAGNLYINRSTTGAIVQR